MPEKCCVPGCSSNYKSKKEEGYISVFRFPTEETNRKRWIRNIPRRDWTPTNRSVVCIKHFEESDVSRVEIYKDSDGNCHEYPRQRPLLLPNAVPKIFPGLPSYLNKIQPPTRCDPETRRKRARKEEEEKIEAWLNDDIVQNFECLCAKYQDKLQSLGKWSVNVLDSKIVFYSVDFSADIPQVKVSVQINNKLICSVCVNGFILTYDDLSWILPSSLKVNRWSQIENILSRYINCSSYIPSFSSLLSELKNIVNKLTQHSESNADCCTTLLFLLEQIGLLTMNKRTYSVDMMLHAFIIYTQSAACYAALRSSGLLILPHVKHIQQLSSSLKISPTSETENAHFLKILVDKLDERERFVILQIDEIYVKPCIQFKGGKLHGYAENSVPAEARTVLAFLTSSLYGSFKEVVHLVPVRQLSGSDLHKLTLKVLDLLSSCGLTVVVIISDNNRINRNMFSLLVKNSNRPYSFMSCGSPVFLMFDTVHLFKSIRNNWLNQRDSDKTFKFPHFESTSNEVLTARFSDIENLYRKELNQLLKLAPRLTYKSVYPSSLERQNVNLVCNIFNDTTVAGLKTEYGDNSGTVHFVQIILRWWSIMNIKNSTKGIHKQNELLLPFTSASDDRLVFLDKFLAWLERWRALDSTNCLTTDTHQALYQSTSVISEIIEYSFSSVGVQYLLTGKLQTDNLESQFSRYRQLSGGNYNISVTQIFESEKKLRVMSVLGIKSAKYGPVKFSPEILNDVSTSDIMYSDVDMTPFLSVLNKLSTESVHVDQSVLLYVCGYAAHKTTQMLSCKTCIDFVLGPHTSDKYFENLVRSGLTVPSDIVVELGNFVYGAMQLLISQEHETNFILCKNQKQLLQNVVDQGVNTHVYLKIFLTDSCLCGRPLTDVYKKLVCIMCNILLNNYTKLRNEHLTCSKKVGINRKINTFHNF